MFNFVNFPVLFLLLCITCQSISADWIFFPSLFLFPNWLSWGWVFFFPLEILMFLLPSILYMLFCEPQFTMELVGTETGDLPKRYSMDMTKDFVPMSVFSETPQGKHISFQDTLALLHFGMDKVLLWVSLSSSLHGIHLWDISDLVFTA